MRPLTEPETQTLFQKLAHYVSHSPTHLPTRRGEQENEGGKRGILIDGLSDEQTGNSLKNLIAPLDDSPNADRYVFRVHKDRVYYVRLSIANLAVSIGKPPEAEPVLSSLIPTPLWEK